MNTKVWFLAVLFNLTAILSMPASIHLLTPMDLSKMTGVKPARSIHYMLKPGYYFLSQPLELENSNYHFSALTPGSVVITGAKPIKSKWQKETQNEDAWSVESPLPKSSPVRQLFTQQGRLRRSRIPNQGWLRGDKLSTVDFDVNRDKTRDLVTGWRKTHPHLFAGFRYRDNQLPNDPLVGGIVQTLSSWESAWQPIRKVNHETRDITLFTPSRYPLVHWNYGVNAGGGMPYAIENTAAGMDQPGEWYYDQVTNRITIKVRPGENPNDTTYLVPGLNTLVKCRGKSNISFKGITFAHTRTFLGKYEQHSDWVKAMQNHDPTFPAEHPPGLTVAQSAPGTGEAILIEDSQDIVFSNCEVRDVGGWAFRLGVGAKNIRIENCQLTQLGAGGVNIDANKRNMPEEQIPSDNIVTNNTISHGGVIHPAAVAIRLTEVQNNLIENNKISQFGYSGISVGWNWNPNPNQVKGNRIVGNDISEVMQVLSDGAGIYTLGEVQGTIIEKNYIHDIKRATTAIGAGNSGIFFDQYSKGALVKENRIERVQSWHAKDGRKAHPIKHNRNQPEDHTFIDNRVVE